MKMTVLASALMALSSVAWNASAYSATDRACYDSDDQKGGGYLHEGEQDVLKSGGSLDNGSTQYPFSAYSLPGMGSQFPNQICLRYELEFRPGNGGAQRASSGNLIQALRWPDVGLPFMDVDPGQPVSRVTTVIAIVYGRRCTATSACGTLGDGQDTPSSG
jgi:hypothetical protein